LTLRHWRISIGGPEALIEVERGVENGSIFAVHPLERRGKRALRSFRSARSAGRGLATSGAHCSGTKLGLRIEVRL
jgi:hypothetical protein